MEIILFNFILLNFIFKNFFIFFCAEINRGCLPRPIPGKNAVTGRGADNNFLKFDFM